MEALILSGVWYFYQSYEQQYGKEVIDKIDTAFRTTINGYAMVSQTLYDEVINTPKIIDIFKQAHTATTEQQIDIRQQLFSELDPTYQRLKQKNLRQLHFHLPDNTSFLRFHKPQKFGDNLSKVRYSVSNTNLYKQKSQGFEEGKIFNGFRYVFPLFDGKQHIGSVETSVSFDAIRNEVKKVYGLDYDIMLRKEVVAQKLFKSELGNYVPCVLDRHFLCENTKIKQQESISDPILHLLTDKMKETLHEELNSGQAFVKNIQLRSTFYEMVFYPIDNVQKQHVAYVMTYSPDNRLYHLRTEFMILLISITFTNGLIFMFLYHKSNNNKLIAEKNKHLTRLNQDKNEFLGIAAHDLKNPLQAIQGSAELIELILKEEENSCKPECKADMIDFTQMITGSVERMFALITNLLDVNTIESGNVKINLQNTDILPMLQTVVNEYSQKAQAKNITIHFSASKTHYSAYVDMAALRQVLDNLISNAVKYSPYGKTVYIQISDNQGQIRIEIQDQGTGISPEEQVKLFGKFARLSSKPTGDEHSTGLGLFIVKKLVDAMQGQVWCESQLGHGSTFIAEFVHSGLKT